MLKSTYKPSAAAEAAAQPLPPGWTEHKAPTGHTYYHNAATGESTYKRPAAAGVFPIPPQQAPQMRLSDPAVANAFMAQMQPRPANDSDSRGGRGGFRGRGGRGGGAGGERRPPPQPNDKPKSKVAIPGCEPWILVYTKYGRRFAYNPEKNASYWRIPDRLKAGILELDTARIREKAQGAAGTTEGSDEKKPAGGADKGDEPGDASGKDAPPGDADESDEYEELEVTDDEDGEDFGDSDQPWKRQRTEEPLEFGEDDIAFQLQAMGQEYGLEPGDYDDGNMEDWPEGAEGAELSEEDARGLFKDMLNDFNINPYSSWDKLIEEGKVFDDPRYTVLTTMKDRKDTWEEWSRDRIKILKEQRAREEKKDPRIPYLAFLHEKANPKLYWPEFKRKYKKEGPMRDAGISDKDREKWYREHINRLKMPQATLKADLTALLRAQPLSTMNRQTNPSHLPTPVLTDIRFISLDAKTRDELVEGYIQTLPPPPEDGEHDGGAEDEAATKTKEARLKREKAMQDRERVLAEEKRRKERDLARSKAALREQERELERAMNVDRRGLQSHLMDVDEPAK